MRLLRAATWVVCLSASIQLFAQEEDEQPFEESESQNIRWDISAELKAHYRNSEDNRIPLGVPFPPELIPVGQDNVWFQTVSPGSSFEVSVATVYLDVELPRSIFGHVKIDFIDLYERNPTSTDKTVDVDEAWVQFGPRYESLEPIAGSSFYALFGKAPKFERQNDRRLESYGLVSNAFNRFEDIMLQVGGTIGSNFYLRGQVSNGNPIFMRDPNALAGDNGTDPPPNPDPVLNTGFPIFYHAEVEEFGFGKDPEYGIGAGFQWVTPDQDAGVDVLAFYYKTKLDESVDLRGTFYGGDLDLLDGAGVPLPIEGDDRSEYGFNVDFEIGGFGAFLQYVHEELATLPRDGFEVELGYSFLSGDPGDPTSLFPVIQPAFRFSRLNADFVAPPLSVAKSHGWDWDKYDIGARLTIIQHLDLTLEYSIVKIKTPTMDVDNNEFLTTLRLWL